MENKYVLSCLQHLQIIIYYEYIEIPHSFLNGYVFSIVECRFRFPFNGMWNLCRIKVQLKAFAYFWSRIFKINIKLTVHSIQINNEVTISKDDFRSEIILIKI